MGVVAVAQNGTAVADTSIKARRCGDWRTAQNCVIAALKVQMEGTAVGRIRQFTSDPADRFDDAGGYIIFIVSYRSALC
jgi:hypothetical protein